MNQPPGEDRPAWLMGCLKAPSVGIADFFFLILVIGIIQTSQGSMLDDPGLGWHLRNVDAMVEQGGWLTTDPFSEPRGDQPQPWRTNQWIGDFFLRFGEWWGGLEGIAAVTTLVLALTFRCLYRMLIHDGLAWPVAALWTYLAAMGTSLSWVARPNIATIFFVLITARVCVLFHEGRCTRRQTLWLLPLFVVWTNTHGGFVAGLILLAATLLIEAGLCIVGEDVSDRQNARERLAHLFVLSAGVLLCTFINPYGPWLYSFIFDLLGDEYFMKLNTEWHSPDFHLGAGAFRYEFLILLFPALLGMSTRRPSLVALGLAILWLHFSLGGQRYVALWVVVAIPMLARSSAQIGWLNTLVGRLPISEDFWQMLGPRPRNAPWLASVIVATGLLGWARWTEDYSFHDPEHIPAAALDRLLEIHKNKKVFHDYNWGGYLTWHGWKKEPVFLNWIDDRNEVQGQRHIEEFFEILHTKPGWKEKLSELDIDLICVRPDTPLAWRLAESPDWMERYRDQFAVIFQHEMSNGGK